jgi:hypothetical protein
MTVSFKEIKFGLPDAESEIQKHPELSDKGFLDAFDVESRIIDDIEFVVLGRKGAGKSIVAQHITAISQQNQIFSTQRYLKDFPFRAFTEVTPGDFDKHSKIQPSWQWVLCLALISKLREDHAGSFHTNADFFAATSILEKVGLIENIELKDIVLTSRKREFKIEFAKALGIGYTETSGDPVTPFSLAQRLQALVLEFKSPNQHILFIDGLDDVLTSKELQLEVLSGLIEVAGNFNELARASGCPIKVVILCRTDLFEQIPNPNKNKIRQSRGVELSWYGHHADVSQSPLMQMVSLRAQLSGFNGDVFEEFLPKNYNGKPIREAVLNLTRHVPRDIIALLIRLQKVSNGSRLTEAAVRTAIKNYSEGFLVPELKDELSGYVPERIIEKVFGALTSMHKRKFYVADVVSASGVGPDDARDVEKALGHLFNCGGLGQAYPRHDGQDDFVFKFRNTEAVLMPGKPLVLMRGLEPAFGL